MITLLLYPVKMILATGLLYGYYWFFLRNRQFHRYNRYYLLIAATVAVIIPFLNIPLHPDPGTSSEVSLAGTLQVISPGNWEEVDAAGNGSSLRTTWLTLSNGAEALYSVGVAICLLAFLQSLIYMARLRKKYPYTYIERIRFYDTTEPGTPFSFFRLIFWNRDIPFNTKQGQQIFRHEWYHVKQRHSLDILAMEIFCCLGWFNPFFHLIKKELKAIHEFLADEYALSPNNRLDYAELLITHAIRQKTDGISHPFSQHEIKRRIMMITQANPLRRSGSTFSRIMVLPLLLILFSAFAIRVIHPGARHGLAPASQPLTVIIDAGHGGVDPGTQQDGIQEKDLTLALAQKINALSGAYNIQVVMTRNNDELPGNVTDIREGLLKRVEISRENKAGLFISLHVNNSAGDHPSSGIEAYVSGRRQDKQGEVLAADLLQQLSSVYTIARTDIRRPAAGVVVLDQSSCPAVLIECGYINRPEDLRFITDKNNQEKIARKILEGIVRYQQTPK